MNDKLTETDLCNLIDQAVSNSVNEQGSFGALNRKLFDYYMGEPFGNEVKDQSQVVSTDCADVVESDMPSLARIFLGAGEVVEFQPTSDKPEDVAEAEEKNIYINYILRNVEGSFKKQIDFLKATEIQKVGILEYGIEEAKTIDHKTYKGLSEDEMAAKIVTLRERPGTEVKILGQTKEDDQLKVDVSIVRKKKQFFINNVPVEDLILTRNVASKNDAEICGKRFRKTRSQLIAMGFDKETVKNLPKSKDPQGQDAKDDRNRDQGGSAVNSTSHWLNEKVDGVDVYVKADMDNDGFVETRHVIKVGKTILEDKPHNHVPYVITSAMTMPHTLVGRSRVEITMAFQDIQSFLYRGVMNNVALVNNARNVVSSNVNLDDLLTSRPNGIVRLKKNAVPANEITQLVTEYIGDKSLQVIQYVDSKRAQTTGSLLANQGLQADSLYKETATRFQGTEDNAAAKVELIGRVIAEEGYKQLYEGLCWYASHFQDDEQEIFVLGKTMTVNPSAWEFDHKVEALVGTGAGDDQKTLETLSGMLAIQETLKQAGSPLVDDQKIYNLVAKIGKTSGLKSIDKFFNDPDKPEALLMAENELLRQALEELQAQQNNPLAEAEMIRAQGKIQTDKMREENKLRIELLKLAQSDEQFRQTMVKDLTQMELDSGENVPGALV